MNFNSPEFAPFFAAVLLLNWLLIRRPTLRLAMLTAASAYFYGCRETWWLLPLGLQTAVDFWCARQIDAPGASERRRTVFVTISVVENLLLLAFFKYHDFVAATVADVASALGHPVTWAPLALAAPAGISFYTFVTMSYVVDVHRRVIPSERRWLPFAFFVGFFPHLVAGPIIRAPDFLPQAHARPSIDWTTAKAALWRIGSGLFKKVVVADYLAQHVARAFDRPGDAGPLAVWVGLFAFTFQIYYDFCGYSDMAVGLARLLGYQFCENFERPFVAASITEFWRRWHISLSTWLRDYAGTWFYRHCPFAKRRHGLSRTIWALSLTMLACGLWHGAAWHFVLWGALHGLFLVVERLTGTGVDSRDRDVRVRFLGARRVMTFLLVAATFAVFRAEGMPQLADLGRALVTAGSSVAIPQGVAIAIIAVGLGVQYIGERVDVTSRFLRLPFAVHAFVYTLIAAAILVGAHGGARPFIYFQF